MNVLPALLLRFRALIASRLFRNQPARPLIAGASIALAALAAPGHAATLNVPSQYATIGAAVSAAGSGDTILVADGTYSAQNIQTSKSLTIQSVSGAGSTIINCGGNYFGTFQGSGTTIRGFTIENCTYSFGVIETYAPMTIDHCVFQNNSTPSFESNSIVFANIFTGTLVISNCTFDHNTSFSAIQPGGEGSSVAISNSVFTNNTGIGGGSGALYSNSANGTISGCTFTGNMSDTNAYGGAVYWINGGLTVTDTTFTDNSSPNAGGGAMFVGASGLDTPVTLTRCVFSGNSAPDGGAVLISQSSHTPAVTATDCLFTGNSASGEGAVFATVSGIGANAITLTNCSLYGNTYTSDGTGAGTIAAGGSTTLSIVNSILYGDTTPNEISTANPAGTTKVEYSDIHRSGFVGVNGNIDADPQYLSPSTGDLHLLDTSPCVGTGITALAPDRDFANYPWGGASMGAFSPIYFAIDAPKNTSLGTPITLSITAMTFDNSFIIDNYSGTIHFTSTDGAATLPADSTLTNGVGTFTATYHTLGKQTITATDTVTASYTGVTQQTSVAGPATHFSVRVSATATAGTPIPVIVTAEDASGNTATGYTGTVHFTTTDRFHRAPANATLTNGTGTFQATLGAVGTQTITATDTVNSSITGTSGGIVVTAGPCTQFNLRVRSLTVTNGAPFALNVLAYDAYGNLVPDYAGTIHFTSTDPAAVLPADAALSGQGTFAATLGTLGGQSVTATDANTPSIVGTIPLTVVNNPATWLRVVPATTAATAGTPITLTVTAYDAAGNVARGYTGTVHFVTADPNAVLPADTPLANGTGTFPVTFKTAGRYWVTVTDTATSSLTGQTGFISVSPGAATHLTATAAQTSAVSGHAFGVVIEALDSCGNRVGSCTDTVHLTSTDPNAVLPADPALYTGRVLPLVTLKTLGSQTVTVSDVTNPSVTSATTGAVTVTAH